ncbi:MaoC family dehydratase [Nocardioides soli]|uniref:Acyl dehydratase n=1 Tax=Nocardioides soli TaxID=1036020 RepID=A0A7W4Z1H0_9ACTN|nr:MaoC family dehydratase [Nocardioides soli]MBB3041540.1 acyl dehydratase [Nocardioides soli]
MSPATSTVPSGPPAVRELTIGIADMIAYAGATWDWHRLHYDPAYLSEKRLAAPVVDGQVFGALVAAQAQDWAGPGWRLAELEFTFRNLVFAGERVRCEAEVVRSGDDGVELRHRVVVIDADGVEERVAVEPARSLLVLQPRRCAP